MIEVSDIFSARLKSDKNDSNNDKKETKPQFINKSINIDDQSDKENIAITNNILNSVNGDADNMKSKIIIQKRQNKAKQSSPPNISKDNGSITSMDSIKVSCQNGNDEDDTFIINDTRYHIEIKDLDDVMNKEKIMHENIDNNTQQSHENETSSTTTPSCSSSNPSSSQEKESPTTTTTIKANINTNTKTHISNNKVHIDQTMKILIIGNYHYFSPTSIIPITFLKQFVSFHCVGFKIYILTCTDISYTKVYT